MKDILKIFVTFVAITTTCNISAQYVTIRGNQFYDENNKPFYPLYLNYVVDFARNDLSSTDYFIMPCVQYGEENHGCACSYFDNTNNLTDPFNCYERIRKDFQNIKDMGFNAVHVVALSPFAVKVKDEIGQDLVTSLCIRNVWNCSHVWPTDIYPLTKPFESDPMVILLLNGVKGVLQIASEIGLKVLLYGEHGDNFHWAGAEDDYSEYLAVLSSYIHDLPYEIKKSLLAYILLGEPFFGDMGNPYRSKEEVCEQSISWYDAIILNDPDHLIGYGGCSIAEVMAWDPAVFKADFFLPHIYPSPVVYEDVIIGGTAPNYEYNRNFETTLQRVFSQIYWFSQNSPLPWVIGETGFSGTDVNYYPYHNGTEQDQADYFSAVLNYASNAGCSGVGIWQYQENFGQQPYDLNNGNSLGLLRHGDTYSSNWQSLKKPAVSVFENYLTDNMPPPMQPCEKPDNYYDPYNAKEFNISWETHPHTVRGKVVDPDGIGIKDEYIEALVWWFENPTPDPLLGESQYNHRWFFDFTDENGDFEIVPYTEKETDILKYMVTYIQGSYIGTEIFKAGKPWPWLDVQMSYAALNNVVLQRVFLDKFYDNTIVNVGLNQDFTARNNLNLTNITIENGALSDIYARYNVNVNNEFHAEQGSEVHIFTQPVFSDCNDYSGFVTNEDFMENKRTISPENNNETNRDIEIIFKIDQYDFTVSILPNPSDGVFSVIINNKKPEQIVFLKIKSITGKTLYQTKCYCNMFNINQPLAAGMYLLEAMVNNQTEVQKVVIK